MPDPLARVATLSAVLQGLGPDAVDEVVRAFDDVDWSMRDVLGAELPLLIEWWGRYDPVGAYAWLQARRGVENPLLMRSLVRAWATRDPAAARGAVEGLQGPSRTRLIAALAEGWLASGRDGLDEYLVALTPGGERQLAIAYVARRRVLRDGIEATFRWGEAFPDDAPGRFKLQAYRRVASAAAEADPERAGAWVERQLDGKFWDGLPERVAVPWAERDPEASLRWLATLPPEKLGHAVEEAYRTWLVQDRERAGAWAQSAVGTPVLEPAVALYALSRIRNDPADALAWAAKLSDETLRHRTLVRIGRAWVTRDPEAARAWLDESDLTPTEREEVLAPRPGRRARGASPSQQLPARSDDG